MNVCYFGSCVVYILPNLTELLEQMVRNAFECKGYIDKDKNLLFILKCNLIKNVEG